jgi:hypothetical protein
VREALTEPADPGEQEKGSKMKNAQSRYLLCGHTVTRTWMVSDDSEPVAYNNLCYECRKSLVGKRVDFIRYGSLPESGYSMNWSTGGYEKGVSVYLPGQTARAEFETRKKITGSAVVVGLGSDDEILIDANTIEYK